MVNFRTLFFILIVCFKLNSFSQCYNINIPEAPPFTEIEITFMESLSNYNESKAGDEIGLDYWVKTGYILNVSKKEFCLKIENRVLEIFYNSEELPRVDNSWLPYIFVPGNKVEVTCFCAGQGYVCTLIKIKNLPRTDEKAKLETISKPTPSNKSKCDIDVNIPVTSVINKNTFALIIGNENYENEISVDFAINDALLFKEYMNKTIGIPNEQIHLITNATYGKILREIEWLKNISNALKGEANIIVYYAGHGIPDMGTKAAYLLPTDGESSQAITAISLDKLYSDLNLYPSKKVTIFLDACFSGSARNGTLVAGRGVKIVPKHNNLAGKTIVFSAVTGNQTAHPYNEMQHGLFSYYLMKKIQESKGSVTYEQLEEYLLNNVTRQSAIKGNIQLPEVNISNDIQAIWKTWSLK